MVEDEKEESVENSKSKALVIALTDDVDSFILESFGDVDLDVIKTEEEFADIWESLSSSNYSFVLCGSNLGVSFPLEVCQLVSNECPQTPLYFVGNTAASIRLEELKKNGFRQIFLFPMDRNEIIVDLSSILKHSRTHNKLRPIELVGLEPDTTLPFDVFVMLPLNKKYIKYAKLGKKIGEERYKRLKNKEVSTLFIEYSAVDAYAAHSADSLQKMVENAKKTGSMESRAILRTAVRSLLLSVFDNQEESYEDGRAALDNCKKIVSAYITGGSNVSIYSRLSKVVGAVAGHYNHATATSVLATLIAIGVDYKTPEDLAVAGFFHDIALWNVDFDVRNIVLSGDIKKTYEDHAVRGINLLKAKKISMTDMTIKILEQHHEKYDGTGFPKGYRETRICEGAQILSLADQLEYLTSYKLDRKKYQLLDAIKIIGKNGSISPGLIEKIQNCIRPDAENLEAA